MMKKIIVNMKKYCFIFLLFLTAYIMLEGTMNVVFAAEEIQEAADVLLNGFGTLVDKLAGSLESEEVMTVYISGIDTRENQMENTRSDVNILVTFNTGTKEILLVSTPRDYFVPLSISNGIPDKLTHAGNYGIDVCVDTMEMLYDIEIDHYIRFNFRGFVNVVDALGGITVYSDYAFDARGYHFEEGENHLDGEAALVFVRERFSFAEGDRQRGKNQMHVIESVLDQIASVDALSHLDELLENFRGFYETDIPYTTLTKLSLSELPHLDEYEVKTYSVDGTGATEKPYSMSENAYVMIPDYSTVEIAKEKIEQVRSGSY